MCDDIVVRMHPHYPCHYRDALRQKAMVQEPVSFRQQLYSAMAPHLSPVELDFIMASLGRRQSAKEIHEAIKSRREAVGTEAPQIWAIRRACRGTTHRRGRSETRGPKNKLDKAQVRRLNDSRVRLLKTAKTEYEVTYQQILKSARLKVHRTTNRGPVSLGGAAGGSHPKEKPTLSLSSRWWCPGPDDGSLAETNFHVMQNVLVQWLLTTLRGHEAHSRLVSSEGRQ